MVMFSVSGIGAESKQEKETLAEKMLSGYDSDFSTQLVFSETESWLDHVLCSALLALKSGIIGSRTSLILSINN
jgi:hypothetical protein